jgi:hypothetical protein
MADCWVERMVGKKAVLRAAEMAATMAREMAG